MGCRYFKNKTFVSSCKTYYSTKRKTERKIFICSRIEKSKKIEMLLETFLSSNFLRENCELTVAGSIINESNDYKEKLLLYSASGKIKFIFEPNHDEIEKLYAESKIFWHAKGFDELNPYKMEHFGISTVEAMSAGCIPVVINKGGQTEIVTDGCGYTWTVLMNSYFILKKL